MGSNHIPGHNLAVIQTDKEVNVENKEEGQEGPISN
jgi:hypothetical protein